MVALALGAYPVSALATRPAWILPQPTSPIDFTECLVGARGDDAFYLDLGAIFRNRTKKTVTAVRLRFDVLNPFDEIVKTVYGTDGETLAGGASQNDILHNTVAEKLHAEMSPNDENPEMTNTYLPTWEFVNTGAGSKYICSVATVAFQDGSRWSAKPINATLIKTAMKTTPKVYPGIFYKSSE